VSNEDKADVSPKRGRGRPRIYPKKPDQPKRPPGRPHKETFAQYVRSNGVTLKLSRAHKMILDAEASRIGIQRSAFLTMIAIANSGLVMFQRAPGGASYDHFTEEDFHTVMPFSWYVTDEHRKLVEQDMAKTGLGTLIAWTQHNLNVWIGKPNGLRA
jgi:hypothetical protein